MQEEYTGVKFSCKSSFACFVIFNKGSLLLLQSFFMLQLILSFAKTFEALNSKFLLSKLIFAQTYSVLMQKHISFFCKSQSLLKPQNLRFNL